MISFQLECSLTKETWLKKESAYQNGNFPGCLIGWPLLFNLSLQPNSFTGREHFQLEKITISSRPKACLSLLYLVMMACTRRSAMSSLNPTLCQMCLSTHIVSLSRVYKTHMSFRITLIWKACLIT